MRRIGRIGLATAAIAVALAFFVPGGAFAGPTHSTVSNGANAGAISSTPSAAAACYSVQTVSVPASYGDSAAYNCTMKAKDWAGANLPRHSWGDNVYAVTAGSSGMEVAVQVSDCCYIADYYSLWVTDDSTLATSWGEVGTTPQVYTGVELTAPTYDKYWTGTGTKLSEKTFDVYIPAGTTLYFRATDNLFQKMGQKLDAACGEATWQLLSTGCSVTGITVSGAFSAAGFTVSFANAT